MRGIGWITAAVALVAAIAVPRQAAADTMDPALARLVTDESCRAPGTQGGLYYNPTSTYNRCGTNDPAFAKLMAEWGFALGPTAMHPARTTGYGGFDLAFEGTFTKITSGADYWKLGTQGRQDPNNKLFSTVNTGPDDLLQVYAMKTRYGFAPLAVPLGLLGFELGTKIGFMGNSNIGLLGADVRISLLEGFRTGLPAIFPDITAAGSVTTITGTSEFQLTVAGFDAMLSKPIPIAGSVIILPYAGYSYTYTFGDSGLIDLTPNTDALNYCGYGGGNTTATPDPGKTYRDGQPVCKAGTSADFNNTVVFDAVRLQRHRIAAGLQFRFQMVRVGAHFVTDATDAASANEDKVWIQTDATGAETRTNKFEGIQKQYTLGFDFGIVL
jgi:hypothetical protein